ncbi:chorismate mutase [Candidatus Oleimmundimicrobium sp.]|uniref:chorismate mutase n=1 Tax=Candidatus Oleimmundimicrobium sp. TaxID=3060597 RepID=UPI0027293542|nr:chorismate mutase [Candidatus Oleimmundimicrobium sp.]MDO8886002.1 chorismate mutase [Candidatus Oleimmundimicrobium sp.]
MTEIEKELEKLREEIDKIDENLVKILNERTKIVLKVKKLKAEGAFPVYDPRREEEIFEKISACNSGPLYDDAIHEIYEVILHCMKDLEK